MTFTVPLLMMIAFGAAPNPALPKTAPNASAARVAPPATPVTPEAAPPAPAPAPATTSSTPSNQLAPAPPVRRALRLAMPEIRVVGDVPRRQLAVLEQGLLAEVRKLEGLSIIGMSEIKEMLSFEYQRQMMGCQADQQCLAEIAGALGVDEFVSTELVNAEGTVTLTLKRIDMRSSRVAAQSHKRLRRTEGGEELLGAVGPVVAELLPDRAVRAGKTRGVAKEVALALNPPPLPRWVFYTTAGAAVLAGAGGGVYGVFSNQTRGQYNNLARQPGPISGAELVRLKNQADDQTQRATLLFGVAGALAVAAVVEGFFTDWHNYRAAMGPDGAGIGIRF